MYMFPKQPAWYDVLPVVSSHVESVVLLSNKNSKKKDYVEIGVDAEDYYKIKANKWNGKIFYFQLAKDNNLDLTDCSKSCSICLKCYTFPMENVVTILRW